MSETEQERPDGLEGLDEALGFTEETAEAETAQPAEDTGEAPAQPQTDPLLQDEKFVAFLTQRGYSAEEYPTLPERERNNLREHRELSREFGARNEDWRELKQLREEFAGFREQQGYAQQAQAISASAPQLVQQHLEAGDYHGAANVAANVPDNGLLYQQVAGAWYQDDPQGYSSYQMVLQQQQILAQMQEQAARVEQASAEAQLQQAFTQFATGKPDLQAVAPEMLRVAEESPKILALLQDPDPHARVEVLDYLYEKAQKRVSGVVSSAAQQAAEVSSLEAAVARQGAAQPSPSGRVEAEPAPPEDAWLEEFDKAAAKYYG